MITLKEFAALQEREREIRFQELSPSDKTFVRLHEGKGAKIPQKSFPYRKVIPFWKRIHIFWEFLWMDLKMRSEFYPENTERLLDRK